MTREEIIEICNWDDWNFATITVYSPLFGKEVEVRFMPDFDSGRTITDKMAASLNDFLALTEKELETVKQHLWEDCKQAFEEISYGVELLEGETETEANHRDFEIFNPEDAYRKSFFKRISIPEEPKLTNHYAVIDFSPEWESHGCSIIVKNGVIIARYSNDWYLSKYE